jgi:threonylcarbamoyladenosine tRNA methylthiotransferase CDKAL1
MFAGEIVSRARQSFEEGVCELWLTSEDTGTYGRDIGTNLPELLWKLVDVIPDGCMMRVGMTNPPYILEHIEVQGLKGVVNFTFMSCILF